MDTQYSYTEDGGREFLENKPFLEPFVQAAAMGAVTSKLELTSNVVKLPVRPPLYAAKMAASIAALTNNRFNFGVGLSVWPEDYCVMGVSYADRGKRFDECIAIVRGLTQGGYFEIHGEFYDLPSAGGSGERFRIFATAMGPVTLDTVSRYAELGVTDMPVVFRNLYAVEEDTQPLQQKLDDMRRFADTVIAREPCSIIRAEECTSQGAH